MEVENKATHGRKVVGMMKPLVRTRGLSTVQWLSEA